MFWWFGILWYSFTVLNKVLRFKSCTLGVAIIHRYSYFIILLASRNSANVSTEL